MSEITQSQVTTIRAFLDVLEVVVPDLQAIVSAADAVQTPAPAEAPAPAVTASEEAPATDATETTTETAESESTETPAEESAETTPDGDEATASTVDTVTETAPTAPADRTYVVQGTDRSLWEIALRETGAGENYLKIAEANGMPSPYFVRPGMTLKIPA